MTAAMLAAWPASASDHSLRLKARRFVPAANVSRRTARAPGESRSPAAGASQHRIIQFTDRVTRDTLAALRAAGAVPLRLVPEDAVAVAAPAGFDPAIIPGARWFGALDPSDKISAETSRDVRRDRPDHPFTVVEFFPDVSRASAVRVAQASGGAPIAIDGLPSHILVLPTEPAVVSRLANVDGVAWMYPASDTMLSGQPVALCAGLVTDTGAVASFATEGDGWDGPGQNPTALGFYFSVPDARVPAFVQAAEISRAMEEWSRYVAVDWFQAANGTASRTVNILWGGLDHGDGFPFDANVLAHTFYPSPPGLESLAGDMHFNETFVWGVSTPGTYDVFSVALHELGHALGLNHSGDPTSVMYPMYQGVRDGLTAADVVTARTLYAWRDPLGLGSWLGGDIGSVGLPGSVAISGSTVTMTASGADVWNAADAFTFASRDLTGDGDVIARVTSLDFTHRWSKAGVMIRDSRSPASAHAFMLVSGQKGLAFQRRAVAGGLTSSSEAVPGAAPKWLRLTRRGDLFEAFAGDDGGAWTSIGSAVIPMGETVQAGLALVGHTDTGLATAVFSSVSITELPRWTSGDVGAVGISGSALVRADVVDLWGAGADIWNAADAFTFASRPMAGDGEVVARVASVDAIRTWSKAGVMIRESRAAGSAHAFMLVSAGKGYAFQRRPLANGVSTSTSGGAGTAPAWVRLTRRGDLFAAYVSADGRTWRLVATETIVMGRNVLVGLAVSSHTETARCHASFDGVQIR